MTSHTTNERGAEGGHLEQRFSRVTMVAMTFAILKSAATTLMQCFQLTVA